jgi:hypothetical protein
MDIQFLFFRILNSLTYVVVVGFLCKRYVIPGVVEQIKRYRQHVKNMEKSRRHIANQADDQKKALQEQDKLINKITKNVDLWSMVHEEDVQRRAKHKDQMHKEAQKREVSKADQRELVRTYHMAIEDVVDATRDRLLEQFAKSEQAESYNAKLIDAFEEL